MWHIKGLVAFAQFDKKVGEGLIVMVYLIIYQIVYLIFYLYLRLTILLNDVRKHRHSI